MNLIAHNSPPMRRRARYVAPLLALLLTLGVACGDGGAEPTGTPEPSPQAVAATATAAGPTATPTPDLALLLKDGGISMIEQAYNRLLDEYIDPVEPRRLLTDAWAVFAQEAQGLGLTPPAPLFDGDRVAAFAAFRAAYVPFANGVEDATKLRYAAIRGMSQTLQDCHTFFLNPVASDTLVDARSGKGTVGIGIELAGVPPLITEVITGGPAARAGIAVGDRVMMIDGTNAAGLGPAGAFDLINGAENTNVRLRLQRPGAADLEMTIRRERVNPPNVDFRIIDDAFGYVRIRNFIDGGIHRDLETVLLDFNRRGLRGWIIDVRGNPGGRLDAEAISLFVEEGVTVRGRGRSGEIEESQASGNVLPSIAPTVLLTNDRTGSVAEVFAAALQEHGVAYVIGANTNGCVGYTDLRDFGDGSSLAVTTHVNLGPVTGRPLNAVGVAPDLIVARTSDDIAAGRDPQLDAAIAHLSR